MLPLAFTVNTDILESTSVGIPGQASVGIHGPAGMGVPEKGSRERIKEQFEEKEPEFSRSGPAI